MAANSFGHFFKITTFGESHGPAIGVVIDGCPANLSIQKEEIDTELAKRRPGQSPFTSPRKETDSVEILSGIFEGKTTGAPIALLIRNCDANPSQYSALKNIYRPGHANFTYLKKFGHFDHRGGGRSSARETAARVAAGAVAKKLLQINQIECTAFISEIGGIEASISNFETLRQQTHSSPIFCPDDTASTAIIEKLQDTEDSFGGIVSCIAKIPTGLGAPVYMKLEAELAYAMLSLPASKGFEIGSGFEAARKRGSENNDEFDIDEHDNVYTTTNFSGGTLGGISTGSLLQFRVAFKPTSSIKKKQQTVSLFGKRTTLTLPKDARHDPCVAIRAVPIVEAMTAIVLADALLANRLAKC